jgi:hypothetical protein
MTRACDLCTECCGRFGLADSKTRTRCKSQSALGCKIYSSRPQSCRAFRCAYLDGIGPKPSKSKVIIYERDSEEYGKILVFQPNSNFAVEDTARMVYRELRDDPARAKRYGAFELRDFYEEHEDGDPPEIIPVFWEDDDA